MTDKEYRTKIVEYLSFNDMYAAMWSTYFRGTVFVIYKLNHGRTPDRKSEIYSAFLESIYDLTGNRFNEDIEVFHWDHVEKLGEGWKVIWELMTKKFKSLDILKKGGKDGLGNIVHSTAWYLKSYDESIGNKLSAFGSGDTIYECINFINRTYPKAKYEIRWNIFKGFKKHKETQIVITERWF